jgi:hypothetical protein
MAAAESKVAPLIVTGSYIGWLNSILGHMTARFEPQNLESLTDEDAMKTVYNYSVKADVPVTRETAPYIAEIGYNDPFYISQVMRSSQEGHDMTTKEGVRAAMQFETTLGKGYIAQIWMEYIAAAFDRVNELNAKKVVLYLAKWGDTERDRKQILEDLQLDLTDSELERRLYKMVKADMIARGSSGYHYRGLGDPVFAAIFRKIYGPEIELVGSKQVVDDFEKEMTQLKQKTAWFKGLGGEYKVRYHLTVAIERGIPLADLVFNPTPGLTLARFSSLKKDHIYLTHEHSVEVDIYARAEDGADLVIEVKNWKQPVNKAVVEAFIELKRKLANTLEKPTGFLLYSEEGFGEDEVALMKTRGIMYTTGEKLGAYEEPRPGKA